MPSPLTKSRLRLFRALTVGFPLLFLLLLESGLRLFDYGPDLSLFVPVESASGARLMMTNPDVGLRYFSRLDRVPRPPYDVFLEEKPRNGYRVFMMGASTVAGFPYPENVMSSRVLESRLADAFPQRTLEVVNVGIAAVNSFTLLDLADELIAYEPDAVLIYAGHNEFYGALGAASVESVGNTRWIVNTYLSLLHLRTVRLLRSMLDAARDALPGPVQSVDEETYPTLMSRVVARGVPYGSKAYRTAERNYGENLDDILEIFTSAGVDVLVSELVSNVHDMPPFPSVETGEQLAAADVFERARALEREGNHDAARAAFYRAKDLDVIRFRASEDFNLIIHELADKHGVAVVPMKARFEAASPRGMIGANLMIEHVHPNVEGYLLMADAFFEAMREHGFIAKEWDAAAIQTAGYYAARWPITELDRALGRLRVMDLMDHWPFRPPTDPGNAFASFQPRSPAEAAALGVATGRTDFVSARLELARLYEAGGDPVRAEREYAALAAGDPAAGPYEIR